MNIKSYAAEVVGTFILVAVGSLTIIASLATQLPPLVVVPFGFGFALLAAILIVGHVSGGHFNPAVTLAALLDQRIGVKDAVGYWVAQFAGAIAAGGALLAIVNSNVMEQTLTKPNTALSDTQAFLIEAILTAIFVAVILGVTRRSPNLAPIVIPLTLTVIHFAAVPLSGASVNPARSLGPALVAGNFESIWVYIGAPLVGAIIGWAVFRVFQTPEPALEPEMTVDPEADMSGAETVHAVEETPAPAAL
jgi:aquaporin Z